MQVPKKQPTHKRSAGFVRIASRAKALGNTGVGSGMAPSPMGTYCSAGSGVQCDNDCSSGSVQHRLSLLQGNHSSFSATRTYLIDISLVVETLELPIARLALHGALCVLVLVSYVLGLKSLQPRVPKSPVPTTHNHPRQHIFCYRATSDIRLPYPCNNVRWPLALDFQRPSSILPRLFWR